MQTITGSKPINMKGVKRWKVYKKDDRLRIDCLARFYTCKEAYEFTEKQDFDCVIAWD